MSLTRYTQKRDFRATPEPKATIRRRRGALRFVVQKHAASTLHYDFRLELDGVMKSWAVPKGPSLDPAVKRLARAVEDHPLAYRTFEGSIPEGNYGAGDVIVWDEGTYHALDTEDPTESERLLRDGYTSGAMKFVLEGKKLRGGFTLVRTGGREGAAWLLMKRKDEYASQEDILERVESVRSRLRLKEDRTSGQGQGARERRASTLPAPHADDALPETGMPHDIKPMLAKLTKTPFNGEDWLFEIKWDGYRAIAEIADGEVRLLSRKGNSFNARYAPVVASLARIPGTAILDGEVVAVTEQGRSDFQLLQNYQRTGKGNLVYQVFDLLYLNGHDIRGLPLLERKELLKKLLPDLPHVRYSDHVVKDGVRFLEAARTNHLEGIMAKQIRSPYRAGERSDEWLKIKTAMRQEAVICGFTAPKGARKHLGALVLGVYDGGELVYVGHAGGGFDQENLREVKQKLQPLAQRRSPFARPPRTNSPVTWVRPKLVCEVTFSEWTSEGIFRQPIFLGLREDKDPREVVREGFDDEPVVAAPRGRVRPSKRRSAAPPRLELTHLDKVYFPDDGFTKGDLIDYYRTVARTMLPYLRDRPHSLHRHPNGIGKPGFFQKDLGDTPPPWIKTAQIYSESTSEDVNYLVCTDEDALLYMVNLGCIEINPWSSRVENTENPDYLVIDLDPEGVGFDAVIQTARKVKEVFDRAGARCYCKTSGKTGIHIFAPLGGAYEFDVAKNFAHLIARLVNEELPGVTSLERDPRKRKKRVYVDFLQNAIGQTLAAPYSVRPVRGAQVSTPLDWSEVRTALDPAAFTIRTVPRRLRAKGDLFKGVLGKGINIERCMKRLDAAGTIP